MDFEKESPLFLGNKVSEKFPAVKRSNIYILCGKKFKIKIIYFFFFFLQLKVNSVSIVDRYK